MTWLRKKLGIESAEWGPFLLMLLLSFLLGGGNVFADASSSALFVAEYGASQMPWVYVVAAVVMVISSAAYGQIQQRVSLSALMSGSMIFMVVITAGIKLGLDLTGDRRFVFGALVWYRQIFLFMDLVFWGVAGVLFNIQQGKRLFGLISTGNFAARILGYLIIPVIVSLIGTANMLYMASVLLFFGWIIVVRVTRNMRQSDDIQTATQSEIRAQAKPTNLQPLQNRRYIYLIFAIFGFGSISYYFIGFNFYTAAGLQFATDADRLATFFGLFSGSVNIAVLLFNTFATSRVLRQFGLLSGLAIRTVIATLFAVLTLIVLLVTPTAVALLFFLALAARFGDLLTYSGIYRPAWALLYQPLPRDLRSRVQSQTEGIVGAIALGLTGVLIIVIGPQNVMVNSVMLVLVMVLWIASFVAMRQEYPRALRRALHKRVLSDAELDLSEASTLAIIQAKVNSPHPNEVVYALELFERVGPPDLHGAICNALRHTSPLVRQDAARRAARLKITAAMPLLREIVRNDPDPSTRAEGIYALASLSSEETVEELLPQVHSADLKMREAVLTGLLRVDSPETELARIEIEKLLADSAESRAQACRIIAKAENAALYPHLLPLAKDNAATVRRAAVEAIAQIADPQLDSVLIDMLSDAAVQKDVVTALADRGDAVFPKVRAKFGGSRSVVQQIPLMRVAARIGSDDALAWLTQFVDHPSRALRRVAIRGLYRARYTAFDRTAERVDAQFSAEVAAIAQIINVQHALPQKPATELLRASLVSLQGEIFEQIFWLLALIYDRQLITRVQENLALQSAEKRAYALELLDVALPRTVYRRLALLLEPMNAEGRLAQLRESHPLPERTCDDTLRYLLKPSNEPFTDWIGAAAAYTIRQLQPEQFWPALEAAANSAEPLLAQTAEWVLFDCNPSPDRSPLAMPLVEKVIILRSVNLFSSIREATLVRVAELLSELELGSDVTLFEKGEYGDNMYIIISGKVRVHIGDETLNFLGDRDVFGEMALLDPEPRVASVTTVEPTLLLSLAQEPLYELMEDQPAVARAIISVLSSHLRDRVSDLRHARSRIAELENA